MSKQTPVVNEQYLAYVERGGCPFTQHKTWCNGMATHLGGHWTVYLHPNGRKERIDLPDARKPIAGD